MGTSVVSGVDNCHFFVTNKLKEMECVPIPWSVVSKFSVNLCFHVLAGVLSGYCPP